MPTPPRRRPRIGDTSTRRALTPSPSSSGRTTKASTPPRKPTTSRRAAAARASGRLRTRASRPRGQPASERMARPVAPVKKSLSLLQRLASMSVRMKVVLSAAAIVIMAGVLSFVFIYFKAVAQLNDEIDKKGARMINILMDIPSPVWVDIVKMSGRSGYFAKLKNLVETFGGGNALQAAVMDPQWARMEAEARNPEWILLKTYGDINRKDEEFRALIGRIREDPNWFAKQSTENQEQWRQTLSEIQVPLGKFEVFGQFKSSDSKNPDVLMVSVLYFEPGQSAPKFGESTEKTSGGVDFSTLSSRSFEDLKVQDGHVKSPKGNLPARMFKGETDAPGGGKMRFLVLLSLEEIQAAKVSLLLTVILPIFLSIVLGVAVAFFVGSLITKPLTRLMGDINAVSAGDLEHETEPHSNDEIGELATTFNNMTHALRIAHQNELEKKAMEHELSIATDIQSNLLPKVIPKPPGLDIGAFYRPSKEVGGDYYDFIMIDDDHLGVIVADVSGKGVPGSLVMTKTQTLIRMEADRGANTSPSDTLKHVNRLLARDIRKGMFVTALYCVLNLRTSQMQVCSAGHNPLLIYRSGGAVEQFNPSGIALGFDKGALFDRSIKEEMVLLSRGDRIVVYTDGVVETMNQEKDEFGDERFIELIKKLSASASDAFVTSVMRELDTFKGEAEQHDDITLVTVRRA